MIQVILVWAFIALLVWPALIAGSVSMFGEGNWITFILIILWVPVLGSVFVAGVVDLAKDIFKE